MVKQRQRQLVQIGAAYLMAHFEASQEPWEYNDPTIPLSFPYPIQELEITNGSVMIPPTDVEILNLMLPRKKGEKGSARTKEILRLILLILQDNLECLPKDFPYQGNRKPYEKYITVNGKAFAIPTEEEVGELLNDVDEFYQLYPSLTNGRGQFWDVYDLDEDSMSLNFNYVLKDTVFYSVGTDRKEVTKSLIEHDGYPSSIVCVPRRK